MAQGASHFITSSWAETWRADLQATPERLNSSLRITLAAVVVLVTMMVLQVPDVAYGLYVIFILARNSPGATLRTGLGLVLAVLCALGIALLVVILTDNDPMARILSLALVTFLAGMITVATNMPSLGPGWGLIFAVGIAFWENHTPADTIVKNSLWLLAAFATGIGVSVAVEYVFAARSPAESLGLQLRMRYRALEGLFRAYAAGGSKEDRTRAAETVSRLAASGHAEMAQFYRQVVDRDLDRADLPIDVYVHITLIGELLENAASFGLQPDAFRPDFQARYERIAKQFDNLARTLSVDQALLEVEDHSFESTSLNHVEAIIRALQTLPLVSTDTRPSLIAVATKNIPFLIPGAIGKPENISFSLKISLSATICYILYHAVAWPGISTSVITVMVAGLSNTGAMKQRLALRLLGTILGGLLLGLGVEVFIFPLMDNIVELVVVIGAITFICAWVGAGPRFNYVGTQMAFAFYITAVSGFDAPIALAPARDRLIGVLLAILVMWFVFDQIWPVRTITAMKRVVVAVLKDASRVVELTDSDLQQADYEKQTDTLRDRLGRHLSTLRGLDEATAYEFGPDHVKDMNTGAGLMRVSMTLVALVWHHAVLPQRADDTESANHPSVIKLRQAIVERLTRMADSLAAKGKLPGKDQAGEFALDSLADAPVSEYSKNIIARYKELHTLVLSLETEE